MGHTLETNRESTTILIQPVGRAAMHGVKLAVSRGTTAGEALVRSGLPSSLRLVSRRGDQFAVHELIGDAVADGQTIFAVAIDDLCSG